MWRNFAGTMSDGQPFTLSVTDDVNTLYSTVILNSSPEIKPVRGTAAQVTLQFLAVDPIKYSASTTISTGFAGTGGGGLKFPLFTGGVLDFTSTVSGPTVITNAGTAPVYPSFTVVGPASEGFNIVYGETGQTISCSFDLTAYNTITVNQRTGRLSYNDSQDITNYLVSSGFFAIPANTSATIFVSTRGTTSSGYANITMSNGYW
jgi:hypothetical protein